MINHPILKSPHQPIPKGLNVNRKWMVVNFTTLKGSNIILVVIVAPSLAAHMQRACSALRPEPRD
jgi:hypothetical protein